MTVSCPRERPFLLSRLTALPSKKCILLCSHSILLSRQATGVLFVLDEKLFQVLFFQLRETEDVINLTFLNVLDHEFTDHLFWFWCTLSPCPAMLSLSNFLKDQRLEKYTWAFREQGVECVDDLQFVDAADLDRLGE